MILAVMIAIPFIYLAIQLMVVVAVFVLNLLGYIFGMLFLGRPVYANEIIGFAIASVMLAGGAWYAWILLSPHWPMIAAVLVATGITWAAVAAYRAYRYKQEVRRSIEAKTRERHAREGKQSSPFMERMHVITDQLDAMSDRLKKHADNP